MTIRLIGNAAWICLEDSDLYAYRTPSGNWVETVPCFGGESVVVRLDAADGAVEDAIRQAAYALMIHPAWMWFEWQVQIGGDVAIDRA